MVIPVGIVPFSPEHYGEVLALLERTPGIVLREADSVEAISRFLMRNPGMSFIALRGSSVVGCAFSGHDGRRGYLHHVAVEPGFRRQGIGRSLVNACVEALRGAGIEKIHLDALVENEAAQSYWESLGWKKRVDLARFSLVTGKSGNP